MYKTVNNMNMNMNCTVKHAYTVAVNMSEHNCPNMPN